MWKESEIKLGDLILKMPIAKAVIFRDIRPMYTLFYCLSPLRQIVDVFRDVFYTLFYSEKTQMTHLEL